MTHQAKVSRGGHLWVIQVPAIRRSVQTRTLRRMDALTAQMIHEATKEPLSAIHVDYEFVFPRAVRELVNRAKRLRLTAVQAQTRATEENRRVARYLRDTGMPLIGRVLGISYQRVHQLLS